MIVALENPGNGEALVSIQAFPAWLEPDLITGEPVERKLDHGFFATEVALWAEDPDEGDILYDFFTLHEKPEWIRPYDSPVLKLSTFNLVTIVDTVALVSAVINPLGLATIKYVDTSLEATPFPPSARKPTREHTRCCCGCCSGSKRAAASTSLQILTN